MNGHHHPGEDEVLGKALDLKLLRRMIRFARPYWALFVLAFLFAGGITVIELAMPYLVKTAVDAVLVLPGSKCGPRPHRPWGRSLRRRVVPRRGPGPPRFRPPGARGGGRIGRRFLVLPPTVRRGSLSAATPRRSA